MLHFRVAVFAVPSRTFVEHLCEGEVFSGAPGARRLTIAFRIPVSASVAVIVASRNLSPLLRSRGLGLSEKAVIVGGARSSVLLVTRSEEGNPMASSSAARYQRCVPALSTMPMVLTQVPADADFGIVSRHFHVWLVVVSLEGTLTSHDAFCVCRSPRNPA
jgi:hypothetical protein